MAASGSYSVTITAVDQASAKIEAINRKLGQMQAPINRITRAMGTLAERSGINTIVRGFRDLGYNAWGAFQSIGRIVAPLGAITGAASLAGMARLVTSWGDFGSELLQVSRRIGITAAGLNVFQGAARLAGTSSEAAAAGLIALKDNLTKAAGGIPGSGNFITLMNAMHIEWRKNTVEALPLATVLPRIAKAIAAIENPTLRAYAATTAFGAAGERMLPFFQRGIGGMEEYNRIAAHYSTVTDADAETARKFQEQQVELTLSVEDLGHGIARELAPVLGPLMTDLAEWVNLNKGDIEQGIRDAVIALAAAIKNVDWKKVKQDLIDLWREIDTVVEKMGGWGRAAEILGGILILRFLAPVLSITGALLGLVTIVPPPWLLAMLGLGGAAYVSSAGQLGRTLLSPETAGGGEDTDLAIYKALGAAGLDYGLLRAPSGIEFAPVSSRGDWLTNQPETGSPYVPAHLGRPIGSAQKPSGKRPADVRQMVQYLQSQGVPPAEIAGILGSAQDESGFDLANVTGKYAGLFQWSPERQAGFEKRFGHPVIEGTTLEQIQYEEQERHSPQYAAALNAMRGQTAFDAGYFHRKLFEVPLNLEGDSMHTASTAAAWYPRVLEMERAGGAPANIGGGTGEKPATDTATTVRGSANVNIRLHGFPDGTRTDAGTDGDLFAPPRIYRPLPSTPGP